MPIYINNPGLPLAGGTLTGIITLSGSGAIKSDTSTVLTINAGAGQYVQLGTGGTNVVYVDGANMAPITDNGPLLGTATARWQAVNTMALNSYGNVAQTAGSTLYLGTTSGTNTYTAAPSPAYTALTAGGMYNFICGTTNTGAATLNISSLGAKSIVKRASTALAASDMLTNGMYTVLYDGTSFHLLNPAVP